MRAIVAATLLFAAVSHAQSPDVPLESPAETQQEAPRRRYAIWTTSPVDWFLLGFTPANSGGLHITVPLGMNVQLSETTDWVFELRPMLSRPQCDRGDPLDDCARVLALRGSVGVAWTPGGDRSGQGFFIQPKLSGMVVHDSARATESTGEARREVGGQVSLGFDVGYRLTAANSRLFLAPVVGVAVGYSWNQRRNPFGVGFLTDTPFQGSREDKRIVDLNLDILRVGFTF